MPTLQEHRFQAERNERFVAAIATMPQRFPEWEATALFYAALHYCDAFLSTQGLYPESHRERNALVRNQTNVWREYQGLFQTSMDSRYRLVEFTADQVDAIKDGIFRRVKEEMLRLLGTGEQ